MWLVPSRRRPKNLARLFDSLRQTNTTTPGAVLIDTVDYELLRQEYEALSVPEGWEIVQTQGESMGDKVRELWPRYSPLDWVGLMGDDNIPDTDGWDRILINALRGWNVITTNDGWQAPKRMAGATLWSGDLIRSVGYVYPTELRHLFIDDLWETLGRKTECWHIRMDIVVKHAHVFITGVTDETHEKAYANWPHDEARYQRWRREEMKDAETAIRNLMDRLGYVKPKPRPIEIRIPLTA